MKLYVLFFIVMSLLVSSCSNKPSKNDAGENAEKAAAVSGDDADLKKAKDCDEFIDQYEKWMDNYLALLDKYMKNPMDGALMQQFVKLSEEGAQWASQWNSELVFCASKEKNEKLYNENSEKAEKKLKELRLQ